MFLFVYRHFRYLLPPKIEIKFLQNTTDQQNIQFRIIKSKDSFVLALNCERTFSSTNGSSK